ncbi:MAG TPA: NADH-quinone oxidoreductase subunit NuoK [Elusimicrobiales bacterium]|nr:NADH-quinone oxidoreductase subunit NuoK [Elusimicrobiales bacterium]
MNAYPLAAISFLLFTLAAAGFLTCGSLVRMLMFLELMLNAANIALVALGPAQPQAQAYALMLFAVAAAEAGVGLALIIALAAAFKTLEAENIKELKG